MNKRTVVICKLFDHDWVYKDYALYIKPDGSPYPYQVARKCLRCGKKEVNETLTNTPWSIELQSK